MVRKVKTSVVDRRISSLPGNGNKVDCPLSFEIGPPPFSPSSFVYLAIQSLPPPDLRPCQQTILTHTHTHLDLETSLAGLDVPQIRGKHLHPLPSLFLHPLSLSIIRITLVILPTLPMSVIRRRARRAVSGGRGRPHASVLIIIVVVVLVDIAVDILLLGGLGVSSGRHGGRLRWDGEASRLLRVVVRSPVVVVGVRGRGLLGRSSGMIVQRLNSLSLSLLLRVIIPLWLLHRRTRRRPRHISQPLLLLRKPNRRITPIRRLCIHITRRPAPRRVFLVIHPVGIVLIPVRPPRSHRTRLAGPGGERTSGDSVTVFALRRPSGDPSSAD